MRGLVPSTLAFAIFLSITTPPTMSAPPPRGMEKLISLVNKLQDAFTILGAFGRASIVALRPQGGR